MISVIIPAYNYGRYLRQSVGSVLEQTYRDLECIIIDNGSTDDTNKVAEELIASDDRVRYHYMENSGVSAARNKGIELSKGDLIQFLDADDLIQPDKLGSQASILDEHPGIGLVYGRPLYFDEGSDPENKLFRHSINDDKPDDWVPELSASGDPVLNPLLSVNFMVVHSPLVRKQLVLTAGGFDESIHGAEDWDLWLRCALAGGHFHFNHQGNDNSLVRIHHNSASRDHSKMSAGHLAMLKKVLKGGHKINPVAGMIWKIRLKVVELSWDIIFKNGMDVSSPLKDRVILILSFPLYLLIKIYRKAS